MFLCPGTTPLETGPVLREELQRGAAKRNTVTSGNWCPLKSDRCCCWRAHVGGPKGESHLSVGESSAHRVVWQMFNVIEYQHEQSDPPVETSTLLDVHWRWGVVIWLRYSVLAAAGCSVLLNTGAMSKSVVSLGHNNSKKGPKSVSRHAEWNIEREAQSSRAVSVTWLSGRTHVV